MWYANTSLSKTIYNDELDYNNGANANGLGFILNKTAEDYSTVVNISAYTSVIFSIQCDTGSVDVILPMELQLKQTRLLVFRQAHTQIVQSV